MRQASRDIFGIKEGSEPLEVALDMQRLFDICKLGNDHIVSIDTETEADNESVKPKLSIVLACLHLQRLQDSSSDHGPIRMNKGE